MRDRKERERETQEKERKEKEGEREKGESEKGERKKGERKRERERLVEKVQKMYESESVSGSRLYHISFSFSHSNTIQVHVPFIEQVTHSFFLLSFHSFRQRFE